MCRWSWHWCSVELSGDTCYPAATYASGPQPSTGPGSHLPPLPSIVTVMLRGHCSTAPLHMVSQCCSGTCCSLITPSINQYLARAETKQRPDNKWDNQQWAAGYLWISILISRWRHVGSLRYRNICPARSSGHCNDMLDYAANYGLSRPVFVIIEME